MIAPSRKSLAIGFSILSCALTGLAAAQTASLRGTVRDSITWRPLQAATVVLSQNTMLMYGTATDGDGYL